MEHLVKTISELYMENGGLFLNGALKFDQKLENIKAYVFDWDGVFNSGSKNENGSSNYNEVDSMGINMLRFSHWLRTGELPITSIISGEKNQSSFQLAAREHFHSCYYKVAHKTDAFEHLCSLHQLKPEEVAFVFDDILDLSMAALCGLRILINRPGVSMVRNHVIEHKLADYITSSPSGNYALREACELMIGIKGNWTKVIDERSGFSKNYQAYLKERNSVETTFYSRINNMIEEANP
jgi:3-deoxy-D-manno-octulosonate 8-phosphate phosphatase (KDO 8-P phosphatase)